MVDKISSKGVAFFEELSSEPVELIEVTGVVKWFDVAKGFGFIIPDNGMQDVLLHVTCLRRDGYQTILEGTRIVALVQKRDRGYQAFRIDLVGLAFPEVGVCYLRDEIEVDERLVDAVDHGERHLGGGDDLLLVVPRAAGEFFEHDRSRMPAASVTARHSASMRARQGPSRFQVWVDSSDRSSPGTAYQLARSQPL